MKREITLAAVAVLALSGCGSSGVLDRERPDEFAVTRAKPIVGPTEFTRPAPGAGAPRPRDGDTKQLVLDAMFGGTAPAPKQ